MSSVSRSLTKYTQTQQPKHSLWALVLASLGIFKTGKAQNKAFPLCNSIGLSISRNTGWWYTYPSEKYDFVSWDDEIPTIYIYMESHKIPWFQTTNQKPNVDRIPMSVRSPDRKIADGFNRYELIGRIIPFVALKKTCHIKIEVSWKWGTPQIIHFKRNFQYKPCSCWGTRVPPPF